MNDTTEQITADDVIGQRIFNPNNGMGLGVALERRTVSNLKGDTRDVFVCATEPGTGTTFRDVDDVLEQLNDDRWGYELSEDPWGEDR